jgi:hypothetical protein
MRGDGDDSPYFLCTHDELERKEIGPAGLKRKVEELNLLGVGTVKK